MWRDATASQRVVQRFSMQMARVSADVSQVNGDVLTIIKSSDLNGRRLQFRTGWWPGQETEASSLYRNCMTLKLDSLNY